MRRASVCLLLLLFVSGPALAGVTLRYAHEPGLYTARLEQSMVMTLSMDDPEAQERLAAINPFEQETLFAMEQRYEEVEGSDEYHMTAVITGIDTKTTLAGQPAPMAMNAMVDLKGFGFNGFIDPRGNIRDVEVTNLPAGSAIDRQLARQIGETMAKSYPVLPDRPLSEGDSFDHWIEMALPMPGMGEGGSPLKLGVTTTYTLRGYDDEIARLDVVQAFTLLGASEQISMTLEGEGAGEATFDLDVGVFTETRVDMDVLLVMSAPERMKMQLVSEQTATIERGGS